MASLNRIVLPGALLLIGSAAIAPLVWGGFAATIPGPADPELARRLEARMESDRAALRHYSYVESQVLEKRASDGSVRSRTIEAYLISYQDGHRVKRRLADDMAQDSEGFSLMRREESRFAGPAAGGEGRTRAATEGLDIEKLVSCFHLYPVGRENLAGRPALKLAFTPVEGCLDDDSRATRVLRSLAGMLWIDESENHLVKVRGYLKEPVSFGFGILGRVETFDLELDCEPLEEGIYAMTRVAYRARGTSFVFHRFDVESTRQRSAFAPAREPGPPPEPSPGGSSGPAGTIATAPPSPPR
jgi:hypothetical protein